MMTARSEAAARLFAPEAELYAQQIDSAMAPATHGGHGPSPTAEATSYRRGTRAATAGTRIYWGVSCNNP